jgi:F420 biosynthesis protein FbiB-like protein
MTVTPIDAARPVQQAIFARRSIRKFTAQPVDREVVARLLDAAAQAPNHRLTRPWRFYVLDRSGPMRAELARVAEEVALQGAPDPADEQARARARSKGDEIAAVPVLVVAYCVPGRHDEETRENYAAVACAMQNIQLAAVEEGLVSGWSTGGFTRDPALKATLGAEDDWQPVGALYIGYAAPGSSPTRERPKAEAFTRWLCD